MTTYELERLLVRLVGDASQYLQTLATAEKATKSTAAQITTDLANLKYAVALPLAAIGGLSVKAFSDFDQAMTESTAVMKVTEEQTKKMKEVALSLSGEVAIGPTDLAKAYYYLASAGLDAERAMGALPAVAKFAQAGMFDMSTATSLSANATSALGLKAKDSAGYMKNLTRVTDVLVRSNTLADATTLQFAEALTNDAAAAMKAFNIDVEEGVAVLAAYADQGNKGVAAGSDFSRLLRLLTKSASENAGQFAAMNIRVYDANGGLRNMADIIADLEGALGNLSPKARTAALEALGFEARMQQVILPILGSSAAIREYEAELRKAGGTTNRVANNQLKSFQNQLKLVYNELYVTAIAIGETLAPAIGVLAQGLREASRWFRALPPDVRTVIVLTAALVVGVIALAAVIAGAGIVFNSLFGGAGIILGVIVTAGAAVAAWAYATGDLGKAWKYVQTAAVATWNTIKRAAAVALAVAQPYLTALRETFEDLWKSVQDTITDVGKDFAELWTDVSREAKAAWEWLAPVRRALYDLTVTVFRAGLVAFKEWGYLVIGTIGSLIKGTIYFMRVSIAVFRSVSDYAVGTWNAIRDAVLDAIYRAEFNLLELETVSRLVWASMRLGFLTFRGQFLYFFNEALPTIARWLQDVWARVFNKITAGGAEAIRRLIAGFGFAVQNLPDLLKLDPKVRNLVLKQVFDFDFNFGDIKPPVFPKRVLSESEKQLIKEVEDLAGKLGGDYAKFLKEKLKDIKDVVLPAPDVKEAEKAAEEAGKKIGQALKDGFGADTLKNEAKKMDAVLRNSAEAISRIAEYRENVLGVKNGAFPGNPSILPPTAVENPKPKTDNEKVEKLLEEVIEWLKAMAKKAGVNVFPLNLR